jgi:hypothetical protein
MTRTLILMMVAVAHAKKKLDGSALAPPQHALQSVATVFSSEASNATMATRTVEMVVTASAKSKPVGSALKALTVLPSVVMVSSKVMKLVTTRIQIMMMDATVHAKRKPDGNAQVLHLFAILSAVTVWFSVQRNVMTATRTQATAVIATARLSSDGNAQEVAIALQSAEMA